MMTIPDEIYEYAKKKGIGHYCTGGGCDFIHTQVERTELRLADSEDTGACPDSIDDKCVVCVENEFNAWHGNTTKEFSNCRDAIDWMAKAKSQNFIDQASDLIDSLIDEYEDRMENRERDGEDPDHEEWRLLVGIIKNREKDIESI